jgi:transposase, IS5 family
MAGALIRELHRKLPAEMLALHKDILNLYHSVQTQKRSDKNKIYSLHEPEVLCIGKGKEHKKYE